MSYYNLDNKNEALASRRLKRGNASKSAPFFKTKDGGLTCFNQKAARFVNSSIAFTTRSIKARGARASAQTTFETFGGETKTQDGKTVGPHRGKSSHTAQPTSYQQAPVFDVRHVSSETFSPSESTRTVGHTEKPAVPIKKSRGFIQRLLPNLLSKLFSLITYA